MDEKATIPGLSIAPGSAPIVDHPRGSASSESRGKVEVRDLKEADTAQFLFVLDHTGNKYPILWEHAQEYLRFKSYAEEIYARKNDKALLDDIRHDNFDVAFDAGDEVRLILPSLWGDFVHQGMTVRIVFNIRTTEIPEETFTRHQEVEFLDVDVDVGHGSAGSISSDAESLISEEEDTEDNESVSTGDVDNSEAPSVKTVRAVIQPMDEEGNSLSFEIDTSWAAKLIPPSRVIDSSEDSFSKNSPTRREMAMETLKITKAVTTTAENRTTLEIHTLPGPENGTLSSSIGIRWFHLHGEALDWSQFKTTCMTIPDASERIRYLIAKILHKIEKEYIKAFLGGLFIEPGTVVRCDECKQTDPHSVIFSCTPYFDIKRLHKSGPDSDRLHPARTLIQSYYPYEPVRDRDEEQAFRSIGNAQEGSLIHIPVLWMLNVGSRVVITCGYRPLSSDFTKSIKVLQEDLKQLGTGTGNSITAVRLTVPDGRVLIYSPQECGTYFQVEQRLKELPRPGRGSWSLGNPQLLTQQQGETIKATPANWPLIIRQRHVVSIDVVVKEQDSSGTPTISHSFQAPKHGTVPPFYHWPSVLSKDEMDLVSLPVEYKQATKCLEKVEDAMLNQILSEFAADGPVERTFTSTKYYESLLGCNFENVEKSVTSPILQTDSAFYQTHHTHHQIIVRDQTSKLPGKTHEFITIVHDTLGLFVQDVNKPLLMRKVWGATANIAEIVERLGHLVGYDSDPNEYADPSWKTPKTKTRTWRIRTPTISYTFANENATKLKLPLPEDDVEFGNTLKRCRRCAREVPFDDPNAALKHLHKHAATEANKQGDSASSSFVKEIAGWKDWIRNDDQALLESTLAGACAILDRANEQARRIYEQLQELADGVRNEQGNLSDLYSFPRKLLETLHRLLVFYFAVERSLHYAEQYFHEAKRGGYQEEYPYTDPGLEVLNKFRESVESSVLQARDELCVMVRSSTPSDVTERISWGAESISSWLMRRLIVKPLDKSMTVGDMYREYLSTLQFQVNHRPGKRLLRSINLLQEELTILAQVNDWQTQLVNKYMTVLDDATYPIDIPSRRALYPYERLLLKSCLDNLALTREEYEDQIRRCGPLSNSTKQSAEINEEDHGKAILVFTVVTVIFLPLSFVTSYLGMNTSDIRDMDNKQSLFWEIALPLTVGIMATMLAIAYNGDEIRDFTSAMYRSLTGKQDRRLSARGISVLQRKRAARNPADSSTTLSMADDAEYAAPKARPDYDAWYSNAWDRSRKTRQDDFADNDVVYREEIDVLPWAGHTRSYARKPAFPPPKQSFDLPEAMPFSYTEPVSMSPPPPPPVSRLRKATPATPLHRMRTSRYDVPSPLEPNDRPIYMRIHKKYILPSVLDAAYLPWDYDNKDPDYMIIRRHLERWETDELFEKSKGLMEGRAPTRSNAQHRARSGGGDYVWRSKKDTRRRVKANKRREEV